MEGGRHRAERAWKHMTTREAWPQAQHWLSRSITAASPVATTHDCRTWTALGRQLLLLLLHLHLLLQHLLLPYNCLLVVCSTKALGMPPCPESSFVVRSCLMLVLHNNIVRPLQVDAIVAHLSIQHAIGYRSIEFQQTTLYCKPMAAPHNAALAHDHEQFDVVCGGGRAGTARASGLWLSALARGESGGRCGYDAPHRFAIGDRKAENRPEPLRSPPCIWSTPLRWAPMLHASQP